MNKYQIQCAERLGRIKQYVMTNAITPPIVRATALLTEVNTIHDNLLDYGSSQDGGFNPYRSGSAQRQSLRGEIVGMVTEIWETAKGLDREEHPGIRDLFRLNNARGSYTRLINTGASFVDHLATPAVKTLFTDRGFDPDFDADLTGKLTAFSAATGIKFQGRQEQKTGTVGLDALMRRATVVVRELSTIVVKHLRKTNPLLIPVWKAAARLYTPAVVNPEAPSGGSGGDPGSGGSTPPHRQLGVRIESLFR
jgi:hypothetical protein